VVSGGPTGLEGSCKSFLEACVALKELVGGPVGVLRSLWGPYRAEEGLGGASVGLGGAS